MAGFYFHTVVVLVAEIRFLRFAYLIFMVTGIEFHGYRVSFEVVSGF